MRGFLPRFFKFTTGLSTVDLIRIFLFLFLLISVPLTAVAVRESREPKTSADEPPESFVTLLVFYDKDNDGWMDGINENFSGGGNPVFSSSKATVSLNGQVKNLDQYGESSFTVSPGLQTVRIIPNSPWVATKWSYAHARSVYGPVSYSSPNYTASFNLPPYEAVSGVGSITFRLGINQPQCSPDCSDLNERKCDGGGYRTCGNYDADPCLDWSPVTSCQYGCSDGYCKSKPSDNDSPSVPQNLTVTGRGSSWISLAWNASTDTGGSGLAGYEVYRNSIKIASTTSTAYVSKSLKALTSYSFFVKAYDRSGNRSGKSNTVTATTLKSGTGSPPPSTPPSSSSGPGVTELPGAKSSGDLAIIRLVVSVPHLVGKMKLKVQVGDFSKEITVSPDNKEYSLDVKKAKLGLNKSHKLVITGEKILTKRFDFTPKSNKVKVSPGDLTLGDLTQDNRIDTQDQISLIDSISSQTTLGDLNFDNVTNSMDWAILLTNFGGIGD